MDTTNYYMHFPVTVFPWIRGKGIYVDVLTGTIRNDGTGVYIGRAYDQKVCR